MTSGDYYDSLETRDPAARERALMAALSEQIARAKARRENEDVKEFYLGVAEGRRKSFREGKHYRRRKRWLA